MSMRSVLGLSAVLALGAFAACSSSSSTNNGTSSGGTDTDAGVDAGGVTPGSFTLEVPCTDAIDAIYGDPGALPAEKGAILKCAHEKDLTKDQLTAAIPNYVGKALTSGAKIYRVLYRTERGDAAGTPGYSSAVVFVPDTPRVSGADGKLVPVIVTSHGTAGQAAKCAPSKTDQSAYMNYPLVGAGYAVIMPDLAGYANYGAVNNPPSAYADVADVGKSTLDGARALRKMFSASVSDKVIIAGHSQGGGTALAALALSDSYGSGGTLAGVVAYAPLWLNESTWGALPVVAQDNSFDKAPLVNSVAIWYMYTHAELIDGAGKGVGPFKTDKQAGIKAFVDGTCQGNETQGALDQLGTDITSVYDPNLVSSLTNAAALGLPCPDDTCTTWKNRMNADRPHFTGNQLQVPILVPYGGKDTTIPADRMACVAERLDADKAKWTLCYDPDAAHTPVVDRQSSYAADWIAARTLGEPEPAACAGQWTRPACATPPPNEWQ